MEPVNPIAQSHSSRDIRADVIALDLIVEGRGANPSIKHDPALAVSGDNVARRRHCAADQVMVS